MLPPELPRIMVTHDLPESENRCPNDGAALHRIGEVVTEQLDIVPMRIQVIRHVRHRYGCRCCGETIKTATLPAQPIPQSIASPGTLAHLAVSKYAEHLPLYRQEQILKRNGLEITRATLAQWMMDLGTVITPLINLLQDQLLEGPLIQMDETPVQVLKEDGKPATSQSYMWVRRGGPPEHPIVLFDYHPNRSGRVARDLLQDYSGILQTDGYGGYDAFGHYPDIVHAGCLAHARRKFVETVQSLPKPVQSQSEANRAVLMIGRLYDIEREYKDATDEGRLTARQTRSLPILKDLRAWMETTAPHIPPASLFGKALHYLNAQWPKLIRFTEDGRIPIDTNRVENAIQPFALGRRNWVFSATPKGAAASARFYSLIETAKANHIEPYRYLNEVFTKLPRAKTLEDYDALLPWNMAGMVAMLKKEAA
ncbi:MAG: IS66 family transposase [Acidiferrobacterales bacterium]